MGVSEYWHPGLASDSVAPTVQTMEGGGLMRVKLAVSTVVAAVALAAPAFADDGGRPLSTTLSGAEECTNAGVCGVGDPDGTGTAELRINPGQGEVCFTISVANIGAAGTSVRAHIHAAPAGSNGSIVVPLQEPAGPLPASGVLEGCPAADRGLPRGSHPRPTRRLKPDADAVKAGVTRPSASHRQRTSTSSAAQRRCSGRRRPPA
jgi:hypothetical protein